jgi:hypothetical protein
MLGKQLKGVMTVVNRQAQNLCGVLSMEATRQEFETHLPAVETWMRHEVWGVTGTNTIIVKPPKLDRSMSWTVIHWQFEAVADHNS